MLQLDPVADREEYAALAELLEHDEAGRPLIAGIDELLTSERPGARHLGLRAANLGVLDWGIWERGAGGSLHGLLLEDDWRCLVVDLGSLDTPEEQAVVAESVLDTLWRHRRDRRPVLIVIDEAHNVCPSIPTAEVVAWPPGTPSRSPPRARKFGLHLLVSTQRPQKVHDNVLSQCDNLVLMRMNSAADLAHLVETFSFVPPSMLAQPGISAWVRRWWPARSRRIRRWSGSVPASPRRVGRTCLPPPPELPRVPVTPDVSVRTTATGECRCNVTFQLTGSRR